jgi:hypothetical protein
MKRFLFAAMLAAIVAGAMGCQSHSGSREYVPGKGWILND